MPRALRVSDLAFAMLVGQAVDAPATGIEMVPPAPPAHVIVAPAPRIVLRDVIERLIAERARVSATASTDGRRPDVVSP